MRYNLKYTALLLMAVIPMAIPSLAIQNNDGIDPEALIERILNVRTAQLEGIKDLSLETTLLLGEIKENEGFVEKERFEKKIYIRFLTDTTLFYEEYLKYFKDDEEQSEKDLKKQAEERKKKKRKRKSFDLSYGMLTPFKPDHRSDYDIVYDGVTENEIAGRIAHQFTITAKEKRDDLIHGTYFFDAESFNLIRVEFTPAKLIRNLMFKLKKLDMSLDYAPNNDGIWLPELFEIEGAGKAAFLFGVHFAGKEYYTNAKINSSPPDSLFLGDNDD
ncbi:MAG: hypothetical protein V3T31_11330 [candidate division Zixibacteria bacterium]